MSKLVLNIEDLNVASFEAASTVVEGRGTVEGHAEPSGPWSDAGQLIDRFISLVTAC